MFFRLQTALTRLAEGLQKMTASEVREVINTMEGAVVTYMEATEGVKKKLPFGEAQKSIDWEVISISSEGSEVTQLPDVVGAFADETFEEFDNVSGYSDISAVDTPPDAFPTVSPLEHSQQLGASPDLAPPREAQLASLINIPVPKDTDGEVDRCALWIAAHSITSTPKGYKF